MSNELNLKNTTNGVYQVVVCNANYAKGKLTRVNPLGR